MTFKEEFDFQILKLTDAFYEAYPNPPFTEIRFPIQMHSISKNPSVQEDLNQALIILRQ